jgi:hypothetical protein
MSKDLIKWSELSRKLSGSDNSIRPNKIPKKYQRKVKLLVCFGFSICGSVGQIGYNSKCKHRNFNDYGRYNLGIKKLRFIERIHI